MLSRTELTAAFRVPVTEVFFPPLADMNPSWSFASASHRHVVKLADDSL